jgi:hypothetical protein
MSGSDSGAVHAVSTPNARTVVGGFALQNATPTILQFASPNDGNMHVYGVAASLNVTTVEVGGAVTLTWFVGGQAFNVTMFAAALAVGMYTFSQNIAVSANVFVTIAQTTALTSGVASIVAAILGG